MQGEQLKTPSLAALANGSRNYTRFLEQQLDQQTRLVRLAHEEVIHRLVVASMVRDDETGAHIRRIGLFSAAVAAAAGWSAEQVDNIRLAAPMHDIGKIGIPDAILLKPGKLTPEEYEVMKTHTLIGATILKHSASAMMQQAELIARSHHEWWDGNGYPDGLVGHAIPAAARVVAIVDFYDALTHDRVYRPAIPEVEALTMLEQGRGTHFDPHFLDAFFQALPTIRELALTEQDGEPIGHGCDKVDAVRNFQSLLNSGECEVSTTTDFPVAEALAVTAGALPNELISLPGSRLDGALTRFVNESRQRHLAT